MSRRYKPKAGFWVRLCVLFIFPFTSIAFRLRWRHLERIPAPDQGGVIIAINHVSIIDTMLMARLIWEAGRVPRFLVKSSLFHTPGLAWVVRGAEQIPVYRGTSDAAESLREAVTALERGEAVVFYPEGTITTDPEQWPMQGKTGIARLVLLSPHTPVVPIGQWGAQRRRHLPRWRRIRRHACLASVGTPLDFSGYAGRQPSAQTLREITDVIMHAVREQVAELRNEPPPKHFFKPLHQHVDRVRRTAS